MIELRSKQLETERHYQMFGCTEEDLKAMLDSPFYANPLMLAASILSDAQEELARGHDERARQYINKSKWVIFETMKENR